MSHFLPRRVAAGLLVAASVAASAGPIDIGDDINARLARARSQQSADAAARGAEARRSDGVTVVGPGLRGDTAAGGALGSGCHIAIGNVFEDKGRPGTQSRRETTVIVTGDVIQVGNNCR